MSLGNVLGAAAPIAAGYFTGGAGFGIGASIGAGAVTGMGIAALSGNDVLMGGVTGGLGGYGGGNLYGAFNPAGAVDIANTTGTSTATANANMMQGGNALGQGGMQGAGTMSASAPVSTQGFSPFNTPDTLGPSITEVAEKQALAAGSGQSSAIAGVPDATSGGYVTPTTQYTPPPDTSFSASMERLGDGSASKGYMKAGLTSLPMIAAAYEEDYDYDFDEERNDKYDPYATLNLNDQDTGINEAINADSGLRLYAEGGIVNQTPMNVNNVGANVSGGGMNVNNVGANMGLNSVANLNQGASNIQGLGGLNVNTGGTSASEYEQSILDKPLYKDLGFTGIGGGPSRVPYDYDAGNIYSGPNYTTNMDGTFTRVGPVPEDALEVQQQNIRDRMAGTGSLNTNGAMNVNNVGGDVMGGGMNVNALPTTKFAMGGLTQGPGDGMSDDIPTTIDNEQPAALSDGEFVVPADVVSHLGNGSTEAGSKQLYAMMDEVRKARTGRKQQGTEIDPERYMPA